MSDALRWLLDINDLAPGAEGVRLGLEHALPAWAWAIMAIGAAMLAWISYRGLAGPRWARLALTGVRTCTLLLLAVLLAGPRLVERHERVERDWVLVLVDRSESLQIQDALARSGARTTRDDELRDVVGEAWPTLSDLSRDRQLVWMGFGAGAFELPTRAAQATGEDGSSDAATVIESVDLGLTTQRRTALGASLDQALRKAAARPLSGVVVLSDGASIDEPSRAAMRRLRAERTPVFTVPLGSETPASDIAVRVAEGPGVAFVNDIAPVTVELERVGGAGPTGATVQIIDAATGLTLAEERVEMEVGDHTITLAHAPADAGEQRWVVRVIPDGDDLIEGNNQREIQVSLIDRPMRVLYIDGYPRWEARYLKNLLMRERSVISSNLLLAPDRRYLQEGDEEIASLPDSPERWAEYDAVILGDVSPGVFTRDQLEQMREHVAIRGAGLLWIGGPASTPRDWFGTPLGDLLPFGSSVGDAAPLRDPAVASPTPLAERLGVLRMSERPDEPWPEDLTNPETGWSLLRYVQRIDPGALKPAADTLAVAIPASGAGDAQWPLVLSMRFGAGRVLYVGTDEIWRWRYGRGEQLPERFWMQMIRLLGRESLTRSARAATLEASPRRAVVEQPVRIAVRLQDQSLIDAGYRTVAVRMERRREPGEETQPPTVDLTLRAERGGDGGGSGVSSPTYSATWLPGEAGVWTARVIEPGLQTLGLEEQLEISLPDDELRRPETDHALLARLAEETGGRVLSASTLHELPELLPNRQEIIVNERHEPLWDTPAALLALLTLLTIEWLGRRAIRLI